MSSFKKLVKVRTYKERAQPKERRQLGILEKKKDYVLRARNYQQKKMVIQKLREKAAQRNPEEFYHSMINSKQEDGKSFDLKATKKRRKTKLTKSGKKVGLDSIALHHDTNYVMYQKSKEEKKVEKLAEDFHFIPVSTAPQDKPKHIIFVDDEEEANTFDAAKHFDTHPSFVNTPHYRPRLSTLETEEIVGDISVKAAAKESKKKLRTFESHVEHVQKIQKIEEDLLNKKNMKSKDKRRTVTTESGEKVTVWKPERKR